MADVTVVGGGLAGSEAAWQLAERGHHVTLYEMRPGQGTEVHRSADLAELVCSNSLRAANQENAAGLLKEELRRSGSLLMQIADQVAIPAGGALAVDRQAFQKNVTMKIEGHPRIHIVREEIKSLPTDDGVIISTGPLTSAALFDDILAKTETSSLYFYDAAAPIVTAESIDYHHAFWQSRYDKGAPEEYLNCPMDKDTYEAFVKALLEASWVEAKDYEKEIFFEGCMPVETMAQRGLDTLRFGPMKPVGLIDPKTGTSPYAVLQLRFDDAEKRLMNLVGCQTRMRWGSQAEVFAMIPALRHAEIVRYGVMHRNTYINSPRFLLATNQWKSNPGLFFAGQLTGVEGYIESIASGLVAGINLDRYIRDDEVLVWPQTTAIGAILHYVSTAISDRFQPMNITFGLFPPLEHKIRNKKERGRAQGERALNDLTNFLEKYHVLID